MRRRFALIGLVAMAVAVGAAVSPVSASVTYDRRPVALSGMTPDGWGQSNTSAQEGLYERFAGIRSVRCTGVIILGHASESSWIEGRTRYWDKNFCSGSTRRGPSFTLVRDAKGKKAWTIYRLKGASLRDLRAARSSPEPSPSNCDHNYRGACVPRVPYDLDCADIDGPVYVVGVDVHRFDADGDGVGCES